MKKLALTPLVIAMASVHSAYAADDPFTWAFGNVAAMSAAAGFELDTESFGFGEAAESRVVKGAPYCADALRETVQPLTDGNRIVKRSSSRLCRDGEGRTRQEVERGGRKLVWLRDPVSKETWLLDPEKKTARRHGTVVSISNWHDSESGKAWQQDFAQRMREFAERMREHARAIRERSGDSGAPMPVPPVPPVPPLAPVAPIAPIAPIAPVVISEHSVRDAHGRLSPQVHLQVLRVDAQADGGAAQAPGRSGQVFEIPMPPAVSWRAQTFAPRGPGVVTSLGLKDIEGVRANGERTSWTIEAGKMGNEKPIVITREVWTSPELMVTVLTTDNDPRSGQTSYRLAKLQRGEPDAALMRVPADYSTSPAKAAAAPKSKSAP